MKLSQWAKEQGVSYKTAWRWFRDGKLPVSATQTGSGTILITESKVLPCDIALYARVSSSDQKQDLQRQIARLVQFANNQGLAVTKTVTEIGSGLNGHLPRLRKLLADSKVKIIVVEHRDRLMRFGSDYIEAALSTEGRKLLVADQSELKDDLVQDMIDMLTSFCARLYGRRSAKNRALRAVKAMHNED